MPYRQFEVVLAPIPFTDIPRSVKRPALVLSAYRPFHEETEQFLLAMITSAKRSSWPLDVTIHDWQVAGLTAPCLVRMKCFSLDARIILRSLGKLGKRDETRVSKSLKTLLRVA